MAHLVAGHVQLGQRVGVAGPVAVGHAEAAVVPEGVDVARVVVDPAERAGAVVADAAAAEGVLVEVPGGGGTVLGVDGGGLAVAGLAVAPGVAGLAEQGAVAGGPVAHVGGVLPTAGAVLELVRGPALGGGQRHVADEDAGAGAGLDALVLAQHGTGGGVGDDVQAARGTVRLLAGDDGLPGELRGPVGGPDDQARSGVDRGAGLGGQRRLLGLRRGELRRGVHAAQHGLAGLGHARGGTGGVLVDDQVAAEHRKAGVGALVAQVAGAVGVLDDILGDQLLVRGQAQGLGEAGGLLGRGGDQLGAARLLRGDGGRRVGGDRLCEGRETGHQQRGGGGHDNRCLPGVGVTGHADSFSDRRGVRGRWTEPGRRVATQWGPPPPVRGAGAVAEQGGKAFRQGDRAVPDLGQLHRGVGPPRLQPEESWQQTSR